jgi:hypothetical protein
MQEDMCSFIYAQPGTFITPSNEDEKPPKKGEYDRKVAQAWADLKGRWDIHGHKLTKLDLADSRRLWMKPLLEALGFEPETLYKHAELGDLKFKFSHRGWGLNPKYHNPPITHIVSPSQSLDIRTERGKPSPHDALQEYLNVHADQWALLTNGLYLRVLRDFHHTYVKGYVEFDLEAIFLTRSFRDFQALYRTAHASRFTRADTDKLLLEEYFTHSQLVGEKIGSKLRENVVKAISALGNGFLDQQLILELAEDEAKCMQFYEEILRIIYRIIFLLYAEQRGMLGGSAKSPGQDLYLEEYSMNSLRDRALDTFRTEDKHSDNWIGLKNTFKMISSGAPKLGIYPYNGMLFDECRDEFVSSHNCTNSNLLEAIFCLTVTEIDETMHRISYADIDVEEIGAIYEGLLDSKPRILNEPETINGTQYAANCFVLDPRGSARKKSSSYYTNAELIEELVKSALEPVINDKINQAGESKEAREAALLSIKVCDPACGSGAFLIAANNRLATRLAELRSDDIPTESGLQQARRDVLQHCIYGVDVNEMAIELTKVSLWINALVKDKPLNFLDHHLKCGDSLIGATPELIGKGVPTKAFEPALGDDKGVASELKKINKKQLENASLSTWTATAAGDICSSEFAALSETNEGDPSVIKEKDRRYRQLTHSDAYGEQKLLADTWVSSFFWPLIKNGGDYPTQRILDLIHERGSASVTAKFRDSVKSIAEEYHFFHWFLEFPEVFYREKGGFDCVLGNPPWSKVKVFEEEWFKGRADDIAECKKKDLRKKMIDSLEITNYPLYREWLQAENRSERIIDFISGSGRFSLSGLGDINTYPAFTELAGLEILAADGFMGMVVKTGIATDFHTKKLFSYLVEQNRLVSLYDFENRYGIFPIEHNERFCLLTLCGKNVLHESFDLSFLNPDFKSFRDESHRYTLSKEDLLLVNPNTKNCPAFKTRKDRDITLRICDRFPILVDDSTGENTWNLKYHRVFDMTNDSALFIGNKFEEMIENGFDLRDDGTFRKEAEEYLPLWEAKLFHQFDHRFGTFEGVARETRFKRKAGTEKVSSDTKKKASYEITARYWMDAIDFKQRISSIGWKKGWMFSFRNVARANTDIRSSIGTLSRMLPAGNSAPILMFRGEDPEIDALVFCALFTSLTFDYVLRQTLGGSNINYYVLKQLRVPPQRYLEEAEVRLNGAKAPLTEFLAKRSLYLTWTSHSLDSLGDAVTPGTGPFEWDDESRREVRAEIDAAVAKVYELSREEYAYVIDTFHILRQKDIEQFGEFRTKTEYLAKFDQIAVDAGAEESVRKM